MRTPHTSCRKGTKVLIILKDGRWLIEKFVERKAKGVVLEKSGLIKVGDIRAFTVYKSTDLSRFKNEFEVLQRS